MHLKGTGSLCLFPAGRMSNFLSNHLITSHRLFTILSNLRVVRKTTNDRKGRKRLTTTKSFLLFGVFLSLCLILLASTVGGKFGPFHQLTLEFLGPVQKVFSRVIVTAHQLKDDYIELWAIRDENKRLRLMLKNYQEQLDEYREAYSVYLHLQNQLEFKKKETFPALSARVVGKDPAFWFKTIIVDVGENDGIVEGMVARTERGVVGQVINVSANYSKILLANAPSSAIDAMVQKNRVRGILKGAGERGYVLKYVLKNSDVAVGDRVVTAGIGGVFSSGIPLGVVSAVRKKRRGMFLEIEVAPAVDFQKLETLFMNLSERQRIREEMSVPGNQ